MKKIEQLREQIDEIDAKIVSLLEERERTVMKIGEEKRRRKIDVNDDERERKILKRLKRKSHREVFKKIIEISREKQESGFD